jgi:thiol:disulfide interchange protein DsbD
MPILTMAQMPISWNYSVKKITDKTYEVSICATIKDGWHLYSQQQPDDAIALPTEIKFNSNPLLSFSDKIKEQGKLEKYSDKTLGVEAWQYSGKVDFVQTVVLKVNAKTSISGEITYQACTDEKCLPPYEQSFTIPLQ